jgi:hypothetical protein
MTDPAKRIESIISSGSNSCGHVAKFVANRCHTPSGMSAFDVRNLSVMAKGTLDFRGKVTIPILETWNLPNSAKGLDEAAGICRQTRCLSPLIPAMGKDTWTLSARQGSYIRITQP